MGSFIVDTIFVLFFVGVYWLIRVVLLFDWNVVNGETIVGKFDDGNLEAPCWLFRVLFGLAICCLVGVMQGLLLVVLLFDRGDEIVVGGFRLEFNWIDGDLSWLLELATLKLLGILDVDVVIGFWMLMGWFRDATANGGGGVGWDNVSFCVLNFVSFGRPNVESKF